MRPFKIYMRSRFRLRSLRRSRAGLRSRTKRLNSCAMCLGPSSVLTAILFQCRHFRWMAPSRPAQRNGRNATLHWRSRSGRLTCAFSAASAPEDCTGCTLCVEVCPVKDKSQVGRKALNMVPQPPLREQEAKNWDFFMSIPDLDRKLINPSTIKNSQLLRPLFEFSGACAGCGETPYVKLVSQLFGDRAIVANATGCSSIYGGNLPTTP